jgi:hypothetical protein
MTGTDLCVNKPHKSRSYLNHFVIKFAVSICIEQSCGKLYVVILMMIYLTKFMIDRLFYRRVSPLWCIWCTFLSVVQRRSNVSLTGSLEEIMLNLQLYRKVYLFYDGVWVVKLFICLVCSCITYGLERTW